MMKHFKITSAVLALSLLALTGCAAADDKSAATPDSEVAAGASAAAANATPEPFTPKAGDTYTYSRADRSAAAALGTPDIVAPWMTQYIITGPDRISRKMLNCAGETTEEDQLVGTLSFNGDDWDIAWDGSNSFQDESFVQLDEDLLTFFSQSEPLSSDKVAVYKEFAGACVDFGAGVAKMFG